METNFYKNMALKTNYKMVYHAPMCQISVRSFQENLKKTNLSLHKFDNTGQLAFL